MAQKRFVAVLPKNYRKIAMYAISVARQPIVIMDGKHVFDFSEQGPLTQRGIAACRNFEILDDRDPILGFHDHPEEMWIAPDWGLVASECATNGWLKIQ